MFTCSWSDFFLEEADGWRDQAWDVIKNTPNNTYQILTKRIENVATRLPGDWGDGYENVWLGVSAENQEMANLRIPLLLNIPAKIKFLSLEPLLGPINLYEAKSIVAAGLSVMNAGRFGEDAEPSWEEGLVDWVIVGGESGLPAYARPMHPGWAIEILAECQQANIPFFFKQWGQWVVSVKARPDGWTRLLWPDGFFGPVDWDVEDLKGDVYQMMPTFNTKYPPLLAGKEWKQFPPVHVGWDPAEQSGFGPLFKGLYND